MLGNWFRFFGDRTYPKTASAHDRVTVRIGLPGMSRDDVEVTTFAGMLRVRAWRKESDAAATEYEQWLRLPEYVDVSRITATMRHGLLELSLPYAEAMKPKTIEIQTDEPKQLSAAA